jgi:hypothetical protein
MVDDLMAQIKIGGTERDDIYTITYTSDNPKLGKDVVQSLLTIFVEGSFGGKKQDSEKAVQFIDDQIKTYEEKLAAAENSLKEFKIKNMGLLPRDGGGDFGGQLMQATDAAEPGAPGAGRGRAGAQRDPPPDFGRAGQAGRDRWKPDDRSGTGSPHRHRPEEPRRAAPAVHRAAPGHRRQPPPAGPAAGAEGRPGQAQEAQRRPGRRLQPDAAAAERPAVAGRSARGVAARPRQRIHAAAWRACAPRAPRCRRSKPSWPS